MLPAGWPVFSALAHLLTANLPSDKSSVISDVDTVHGHSTMSWTLTRVLGAEELKILTLSKPPHNKVPADFPNIGQREETDTSSGLFLKVNFIKKAMKACEGGLTCLE